MTGNAVLPCSLEPRLVLGAPSCHVTVSSSSATWGGGRMEVLPSAVLVTKCPPGQVPDLGVNKPVGDAAPGL